jgi:C-terminal processing protease CtpA/Prc
VKWELPSSNPGFGVQPQVIPPTVFAVVPNRNALAVGDQIVAIDDIPTTNLHPNAAMALVLNHRPGTAVTLQVLRNGAPLTVRAVVTP